MRRLSSAAILIGLSMVLVLMACSTEIVREVPVEKIVTQEVIREVPVERVIEVEKEVVRTVEIEKPIEVIKEVVKEVEVPGKTVVVEKPVITTQIVVATPTPAPIGAGPSGTLVVADADIAFPNMIPCKFAYNPQQNVHRWSVFDTVNPDSEKPGQL